MARYSKDFFDDKATQSAAKHASKMSDAVDKVLKKNLALAAAAEKAAAKVAAAQEKAAAAAEKSAARQRAAAEKAASAVEKSAARRIAAESRAAAKQAADAERAYARQNKAIADGIKFSNRAREAAQKARAEELDRTNVTEAMASATEGAGWAIGAVEAAAAAAAVAVTALVAAMAFLAAKAIAVVQERSALLATFVALGGGAAAGQATLAIVDKLAEKLPIARDKIDAMARSLMSAGFRGQALGKAVEAVAAATAIMHNEAGGAAAESMLKTLAEGGKGADKMVKAIREGGGKANKLLEKMGLNVNDIGTASQRSKMSVDDMGKAIEKALVNKASKSGAMAEMAATFPVMFAKIKEGALSLFEGLGPSVKPFMAAVQGLFAQFYRGGPAMKALRPIVTEVFGTLFKYATMAVQAISKFVRENLTAKNIGKTWHDVKAAIAKVASALMAVWTAIKPIVTSSVFIEGLTTIFYVLGAAVVIVVGTMGAMMATMTAIVGAISMVATALWACIGMFYEFAASIVEGVMSFDYSAFVAKMAQMAQDGLKAFKSVFQFGSPSKVMAGLGEYIGEGAEVGTDRSRSGAVNSAKRLGTDMAKGAATGVAGKGAAGAKGGVNVGELHLHTHAPTTGGMVEELFAAFIDRLALSQGT